LDHEEYTPGYNTPVRYLVTHFWATGVKHRWDYPAGDFGEETLKARTDLKLFTGGKAKVARKSLIHISASAVEYGRPAGAPWYQTPATSVAAARIQMLGWWLFGRQNPDPNGDLYLALPDNAVKNLNLRVKGAKHYDATVNATRHDLLHETLYPAWADSNLARTQLGVGEYVNCWFEPGNFPTNGVWAVSAGGLDMTTGNAVWFTAPSNAASATVTVNVAGTAKFEIKFEVKEPSSALMTTNGAYAPDSFIPGQQGVCMRLLITLLPLDVSFYRVGFKEISGPANNITGYFTNFPATNLAHAANPNWASVNPSNRAQGQDHAHISDFANLPWAAGGFDWVIPVAWTVGQAKTNGMFQWIQTFRMLDSAGTTTISKQGATATRTP
jgi:hypothetical protein